MLYILTLCVEFAISSSLLFIFKGGQQNLSALRLFSKQENSQLSRILSKDGSVLNQWSNNDKSVPSLFQTRKHEWYCLEVFTLNFYEIYHINVSFKIFVRSAVFCSYFLDTSNALHDSPCCLAEWIWTELLWKCFALLNRSKAPLQSS